LIFGKRLKKQQTHVYAFSKCEIRILLDAGHIFMWCAKYFSNFFCKKIFFLVKLSQKIIKISTKIAPKQIKTTQKV